MKLSLIATFFGESEKKISILDSLDKELHPYRYWWEHNWWWVVLLVIALVAFLIVLFTIILPRLRKRQERKISIPNHYEPVLPEKIVSVTMIGQKNIQLVKGEFFSVPVPTRDGYDFAGWFYDSACTIPYKNIRIKKNIVLYPKWVRHG